MHYNADSNVLRRDDDTNQLSSVSTTSIECIFCNGRGGDGDNYILTITAGGAVAVHSLYRDKDI